MIRTDEIRIIPQFSGQTTGITESDLSFRSGYWVYTSSFGGNLVDEFTVRDFLDNPNNEQIATDFFNFLQENFLKPEFNELYYNNLKLANSFNDYYDKTVRSNVSPTKTVAQLQLTATTAVTYTNTNFIDYKNRSNKKLTVVIGYNTGDSYYLNVPISSSYSILDNQNYDKYRKNSLGEIKSYTEYEWFRYMLRAGQEISVPDINVVKENSFDNFVFVPPMPSNPPQIKIQFKNDKYIIPNGSQNNRIPIEVVFDKPSPFQGQSFQVRIDSVKGGPLYKVRIDDGSGNLGRISQNFSIIQGLSSVTSILELKDLTLLSNPNLEINVQLFKIGPESLVNYVISSQPFIIQTQKPTQVTLTNNLSYNYIKESTKFKPQVLLQSFVDLNFNDSESEIFRNIEFSQTPKIIP